MGSRELIIAVDHSNLVNIWPVLVIFETGFSNSKSDI